MAQVVKIVPCRQWGRVYLALPTPWLLMFWGRKERIDPVLQKFFRFHHPKGWPLWNTVPVKESFPHGKGMILFLTFKIHPKFCFRNVVDTNLKIHYAPVRMDRLYQEHTLSKSYHDRSIWNLMRLMAVMHEQYYLNNHGVIMRRSNCSLLQWFKILVGNNYDNSKIKLCNCFSVRCLVRELTYDGDKFIIRFVLICFKYTKLSKKNIYFY